MQTLNRLGLIAGGIPTRRAAVLAPVIGATAIAGGVALWLFS